MTRHPAGANKLARDFTATAPNQKWVVDITYVPTQEGNLYLAGVLDLFPRKMVGWAMDDNLRDELTQAALRMALLTRQLQAGLLHNSDRGSQYTSVEYQAIFARFGIGSASRVLTTASITLQWRVSGVKSKLSVYIAFTSKRELRLEASSLLISKASTIANGSIQHLAMSRPNNLNKLIGQLDLSSFSTPGQANLGSDIETNIVVEHGGTNPPQSRWKSPAR